MKRIAIKLVIFLLLGAVTTVAVAWGCAYWIELDRNSQKYDEFNAPGLPPDDPQRERFDRDGDAPVMVSSIAIKPLRGMFLPLGPLALGLATNTLFYAAILWLLWSAPFATRHLIRKRRGHCLKCGYDLRHAEHEVCPECGAKE